MQHLTLWACIGVTVVGLVGMIAAERLGRPALLWLWKPLASAGFVAAGMLSPTLAAWSSKWLVVGLCFAALGDVLLIPRGKRAFLAGLVAFLVGHVCYAVAFGVMGVHPLALGVAGAAVLVVAVFVCRWLMPHVEGPMRVPVLAYVTVISAMVALSASTFVQTRAWLPLLGAGLFYVSDLAVARERFVTRGFVNRAWGLPTYYGGQLVLAASLWVG